ncbi:hypothetical protein [Carnobacterium maltaromaticum]|nr:hypothetical protein [Carnobacterium maltaromaticum]
MESLHELYTELTEEELLEVTGEGYGNKWLNWLDHIGQTVEQGAWAW